MIETIIHFNYSVFNKILDMLNGLPEILLIIFGPVIFAFISTFVLIADHLYLIYLWFAQMGWFFTKAALLTFGGAYAVLPYVYQGAVDQFAWVTAQQMMDGLELGETTPGPLIMVVAFVAFVGGYVKALLGPESLFLAGGLAAALAAGLAAALADGLAAVFLAGGLGINKPHVFSIFLNKLFPHLNVIPHKGRKNLVGDSRVGRGYLQKRPAG